MPSRADRVLVEQRARARCEYCRAPQVITGATYHVEHIIPSAREGLDVLSNYALSCITCNGHKSGHITGTDPETGNEVALFNPRRARWQGHFRFSRRTLCIEGITSRGRATVLRLGMNEKKQIEARALWVALDIFP
jgi:hypothetical protein